MLYHSTLEHVVHLVRFRPKNALKAPKKVVFTLFFSGFLVKKRLF